MANHDVPPLVRRRPGLHPAVTRLVHGCLDREPDRRFPSWHELARALAGVQALFPPAGPAEIARYVQRLVPGYLDHEAPPVAAAPSWKSLPHAVYHAITLPVPSPAGGPENGGSRPFRAPAIDPDAIYWPVDARPMYELPSGLMIDARPVTAAEVERFCITTLTRRPAHMGEPSVASEDEPCALVSVEDAEAYARWAGKRLPTEVEWAEAVAALGAPRLGIGDVWEWTSTPHENGGRVVRGGRWRDQVTMPAAPDHRSFQIGPAADVGFRCVAGPGGRRRSGGSS
jgi:hypothetical protein